MSAFDRAAKTDLAIEGGTIPHVASRRGEMILPKEQILDWVGFAKAVATY